LYCPAILLSAGVDFAQGRGHVRDSVALALACLILAGLVGIGMVGAGASNVAGVALVELPNSAGCVMGNGFPNRSGMMIDLSVSFGLSARVNLRRGA
jgi:hypothetical protein